MLHEAMIRRLYRRSSAEGHIRVPAVPSLIDEYVQLCGNVCATLGVWYTAEQSAQLRTTLEAELTKGFKASPRSDIVISYNAPFGTGVNFRVKAEWRTLEADYDEWVAVRPPPLFGTEPDARVLALAAEAADPTTHRVLDVGAGTGRNALALARRGHPVDAVEMAGKLADVMRSEAQSESLGVQVIQSDVFTAMENVHEEYQLMVLSEVVPDFRTTHELRGVFELAADCLAPGGRLVFNAFLPREGYVPDDAAVELGQQCNTHDLHARPDGERCGRVAPRAGCRRFRVRIREGPPARGRLAADGLVRGMGQRSRCVRRRARALADRVALARLSKDELSPSRRT